MFLEVIILFLTENAAVLGALGGLAGTSAIIWSIVKAPFTSKPKPVEITSESVQAIIGTTEQLTVSEFLRIRRAIKAEVEAEFRTVPDDEKAILYARITELEAQIANPHEALIEANQQIADLEALLEPSGNDIGGYRIAEARATLEKGDYSIADDIFAEIEARNELAVRETARAVFGRGEIAEAEVRWADAAAHYAKAAKLDERYETLRKASDFAERSGDFQTASQFSRRLLLVVRAGEDQQQLSGALNEHALNQSALGLYEEAEDLFREALKIDRATIGERHPDYATDLNNLANVVKARGRYEEAEDLFREALEIDRATIGERHPDYATDLNNLANVVRRQRRYEEAESLFREALDIDYATIGERHPSYAAGLNNLAGVVKHLGRYEEARLLYDDALLILKKTLPPDHPHIELVINNLAALPKH